MKKNFEVTFKDLSIESQMRMIIEEKESEEILELAAKSENPSIGLMVAKSKNATSEILDTLLDTLSNTEKVDAKSDIAKSIDSVLIAILNNPNFKKTKANYKKLTSCGYRVLLEILKDENTPYDVIISIFESRQKELERLFYSMDKGKIITGALLRQEYFEEKDLRMLVENYHEEGIIFAVIKYKYVPTTILDEIIKKSTLYCSDIMTKKKNYKMSDKLIMEVVLSDAIYKEEVIQNGDMPEEKWKELLEKYKTQYNASTNIIREIYKKIPSYYRESRIVDIFLSHYNFLGHDKNEFFEQIKGKKILEELTQFFEEDDAKKNQK